MAERHAGAVEGMPRLLLRIGGAALAVAAAYMLSPHRRKWWLFAALILVPDVSFAGYLVNTRIGAIAYNTMHVTLGPLICAALGFLLPSFDLLVDRADLGRACRHRSRARLRAEIRRGLRTDASRPHRRRIDGLIGKNDDQGRSRADRECDTR